MLWTLPGGSVSHLTVSFLSYRNDSNYTDQQLPPLSFIYVLLQSSVIPIGVLYSYIKPTPLERLSVTWKKAIWKPWDGKSKRRKTENKELSPNCTIVLVTQRSVLDFAPFPAEPAHPSLSTPPKCHLPAKCSLTSAIKWPLSLEL